jgi:hypothetical protein
VRVRCLATRKRQSKAVPNLVEPARKASNRFGTSARITSGCHSSNQHSSSLLESECHHLAVVVTSKENRWLTRPPIFMHIYWNIGSTVMMAYIIYICMYQMKYVYSYAHVYCDKVHMTYHTLLSRLQSDRSALRKDSRGQSIARSEVISATRERTSSKWTMINN